MAPAGDTMTLGEPRPLGLRTMGLRVIGLEAVGLRPLGLRPLGLRPLGLGACGDRMDDMSSRRGGALDVLAPRFER